MHAGLVYTEESGEFFSLEVSEDLLTILENYVTKTVLLIKF